MKKLRKNFQDKLADAGTVAEECISSIRTVRAFNGEKKVLADYNAEIMKSYDIAKKLAFGTGKAFLKFFLNVCKHFFAQVSIISVWAEYRSGFWELFRP